MIFGRAASTRLGIFLTVKMKFLVKTNFHLVFNLRPKTALNIGFGVEMKFSQVMKIVQKSNFFDRKNLHKILLFYQPI